MHAVNNGSQSRGKPSTLQFAQLSLCGEGSSDSLRAMFDGIRVNDFGREKHHGLLQQVRQ